MSHERPWDEWIPGVLTPRQLTELCEAGCLRPPSLRIQNDDQSSFDLTLADDGYRLTRGAVKPGAAGYLRSLEDRKLVDKLSPESDGTYMLQRGATYLFRVKESLSLGHRQLLADAGFYGQATARSSVGRLDVLARLVFDGMAGYEGFDPNAISQGSGEMFLEITPISFNVLVKPGIALSQLRIFYGRADDVIIKSDPLHRTAIRNSVKPDGTLTVDLSPTKVGKRSDVVALSPKKGVTSPVRLWKWETEAEKPDPRAFWERVSGEPDRRLEIEPGRFYILRSRERMCMPAGVAVYCRASDETLGEMRIHYAGFVHPFFGAHRSDGEVGTPLIFEVRGHDFPVNLQDGEIMARLTFYRLAMDAVEPATGASYNEQILKLSSFFPDWPLDD